ncbi:MAG: hypothetical protein HRT45_03270 [Bdellovibrionales bacterium]|nr:hypothetical protein [Bdellovibrionales bacterium]
MTFKNHYVFSRGTDLTVFFFVPLLGLLVAFLADSFTFFLFPAMILAVKVLDFSHLMVTTLPLYIRYKRGVFGLSLFAGLLLFPFLFAAVMLSWNRPFFISLMVVLLVQHLVKQFLGWIQVSQKENGVSILRFHDTLFFYLVALLPFLLNYSEIGIHGEAYFFKKGDSQILSLGAQQAGWAYSAYLAAPLLYLPIEAFRIIKTGEMVVTKYLLLFSAWFCLGFCYLTLPLVHYYVPHTFQHCYSYIRFNHKHMKSTIDAPKVLGSLFAFFVISFLLGFGFYQARALDLNEFPLASYLLSALLWSVPLSHYLYDMIIWRFPIMKKLYSKPIGPGSAVETV